MEILSHTKRKMRNSQLFHRCSAPAEPASLQLSFTVAAAGQVSVCCCLLLQLPTGQAAARELLHFLFYFFKTCRSFLFYFHRKSKHPIFKIGEPERPIKP
ncbi:hypothetical protein [Methanimicrococcus hongohii]|uniref:hypothetical protein n=1 Tax=Methanimicrococcus hongohii TaxID=3028295 RepID=UPI00292F9A7C|nr:hypothetical protein [Methanimicrococcus sp. Hf6]